MPSKVEDRPLKSELAASISGVVATHGPFVAAHGTFVNKGIAFAPSLLESENVHDHAAKGTDVSSASNG